MLTPQHTTRVVLTALIALAGLGSLSGCTSTPVVETHTRAIAPRILPGARGYVVCADCDNFLPTPKHVKTPAAPASTAKATRTEPSVVPLTLSVVAGEQIVSLPKPVGNIPATSTSASATAPAIAPAASTATAARSITILFMRGQARIGAVESRKLRAFLKTVNADSTYVIRGFTDASGSATANRRLAVLRASAVKTFVMQSNHTTRVSIDATAACCEGSIRDPETVRAKQRRAEMEFF